MAKIESCTLEPVPPRGGDILLGTTRGDYYLCIGYELEGITAPRGSVWAAYIKDGIVT